MNDGCQGCESLRTEVERLRGQLDSYAMGNTALRIDLGSAKAEVERLHIGRGDALMQVTDLRADLARAREERDNALHRVDALHEYRDRAFEVAGIDEPPSWTGIVGIASMLKDYRAVVDAARRWIQAAGNDRDSAIAHGELCQALARLDGEEGGDGQTALPAL